jgi:isopenicillin N synthase-like dioxygenase
MAQLGSDTAVAPVIDIAPFSSGANAERIAVARRFGAACEHTGFLIVTGHGVPTGVTQHMLETCRAFFALPEDEKRRLCPAIPNGPGYRPVASHSLAQTLDAVAPGDLNEGYLISPLLAYRQLPPAYVASDEGTKWFRDNLWPSVPADFQAAWTAYYREMATLASTLMRIAALALDVPETTFDGRIDRHTSQLSARRYPPVDGETLPNQQRAGAHTDYGAITILWKDEGSDSLQVMGKDGDWKDVIPVAGCFIVNIGDLLAQWTNDRWVSTLHRVVAPRDSAARSRSRYSIPFFFKPNYDAVIEPIPSCIGNGRSAKYAPIRAGDHMAMKRLKHVVAEAY